MGRVHARAVVAGVHHNRAGWNISMGQHIRHAVGIDMPMLTVAVTGQHELTVALTILTGGPLPTSGHVLVVFGRETCDDRVGQFLPTQLPSRPHRVPSWHGSITCINRPCIYPAHFTTSYLRNA